jgi:hypothetical protein
VSVLLNAANGNFTGQTRTVDTVAPTVASVLRQNPLAATTGADQLVFRVTFSEAVQNVSTGDFTLGGTSAADGTVNAVASVSTSVYDVTITGVTNSNGTIQLLFAAGQNITDLATNALTNTTPTTTETYTLVNNRAPTLNATGNPFAILGAGSRQSSEMRHGTLVSDLLARGAGGNPISDLDAGALKGIAITAVDKSLGTVQYTLVTANPQEADWKDVEAAGAVSGSSALLLPTTARLRFTTGLIPHHSTGAPFLTLESKLDTGLTFRAWDQTSGAVEGRADTTTNGGASAFSTAVETAKIYFEARLFRSFNTNASLNIYTLEAEFNALTANPAIVDRSTSAFTGFTVLLSAVPELGTAPLFRMYFGVQFNDDGTETDMGYRYLTSRSDEADILEGLGRADKRPTREGAYFRELGVNAGSAALGYIYSTQQPGTLQMTQVYRTDAFPKPTRPGGTPEGSTPTTTKSQEQGDHVYTTNTAFETGRPGTWRVEASRGFVRELTPNPTGGPPPLVLDATAMSGPAVTAARMPAPVPASVGGGTVGIASSVVEAIARLVAAPSRNTDSVPASTPDIDNPGPDDGVLATSPATDDVADLVSFDTFFTDSDLVAAAGWGV